MLYLSTMNCSIMSGYFHKAVRLVSAQRATLITFLSCIGVCLDSLHHSKQIFSHVGTDLPGLHKWIKVFC